MSDWLDAQRMSEAEVAAAKEKWCQVERGRFWGSDYEITPELLPMRWGDGQCAMTITPMNTRPNYYVVLVDSRLSDQYDNLPEEFYDELKEDLYCAIEERFGRCYCDEACPDCEDKGEEICDHIADWPTACCIGSSSFGEFYESIERGRKRREEPTP